MPGDVGWWSLLGHADTFVETTKNAYIVRIVGHLQQASLIPAYFLLPLSISLAFLNKNQLKVIIPIILLCFLSMGGNTYFALIITFFTYMLSSFIPRYLLIAIPFITLFLVMVVTFFFTMDLYDPGAIKEVSRQVSSNFHENYLGGNNALNNRLSSAVGRLSLIGFQVNAFFEHFPFPAPESIVNLTIGGNLMTNSLRGGFFGFIATIFMYYILFWGVTKNLCKNNSLNKVKRLGFSLIYSLILQSFIYNDFGFSTYYGYIIFSIIILLSFSRENNSQVPQKT